MCPFLIKDDSGQRTRRIAKNHDDVEGCRQEMLQVFLREKPNPTWRDVVNALKDGSYDNLAKEIEQDLQG